MAGDKWEVFIECLLSNINSPFGYSRLESFKRIPNFFEPWFTVECLHAIKACFPNTPCYTNENKFGFSKPDILIEDGEEIYVLELKHFPTASSEARGRFDGGKNSTAVKDYKILKAVKSNKPSIRKLLWLYGPALLQHDVVSCKKKGIKRRCLNCMMDDFGSAVGISLDSKQWKVYPLKSEGMTVVEVDVLT